MTIFYSTTGIQPPSQSRTHRGPSVLVPKGIANLDNGWSGSYHDIKHLKQLTRAVSTVEYFKPFLFRMTLRKSRLRNILHLAIRRYHLSRINTFLLMEDKYLHVASGCFPFSVPFPTHRPISLTRKDCNPLTLPFLSLARDAIAHCSCCFSPVLFESTLPCLGPSTRKGRSKPQTPGAP